MMQSELNSSGNNGASSAQHRPEAIPATSTASATGTSPAGTHLLDLINQVLDLSKIEAGKLEFNPETVNVPRLVDEVVGTVRPLASQNKNRLTVDYPSDVKALFVDPLRAAADSPQSSEQCMQIHRGW
jgi:signal transduction histidine kinase